MLATPEAELTPKAHFFAFSIGQCQVERLAKFQGFAYDNFRIHTRRCDRAKNRVRTSPFGQFGLLSPELAI
jgi:hypothetical protein